MARVPKSYPVDPIREREVAHFQYLNQVPPLELGGPIGINPSFDFFDDVRKPYSPEDHGYKPPCKIHVQKPPEIVALPCVIRLDVVSLEGVWNLEDENEPKSRAAVTIEFPGERSTFMLENNLYELDSPRTPKTPKTPRTEAIDIPLFQILQPEMGALPIIPPKVEPVPGIDIYVHSTPSTPGSKKEDHKKDKKAGKTDDKKVEKKNEGDKKTHEGKKKGDTKVEKKGKGEPQESPPPPIPATFEMRVGREIERFSEWKLWHTFMHEPIVITLFRLSSDSSSKIAIARTEVDLNPLLHPATHKEGSPGNPFQFACPLELIEESNADSKKHKKGVPEKATSKEGKAEKGGKEGKDIKASGKKDKARMSQQPKLLPGACVHIALHTSYPLLSKIDIEEGVFMKISNVEVRPLPSKVIEFFEHGSNPFQYKVGFHIPGFMGSWWHNLKGLDPQEKKKLSTLTAMTDELQMDPPPEVLFPEIFEEERLKKIEEANKQSTEEGSNKKINDKDDINKNKKKESEKGNDKVSKKKQDELEVQGIGKDSGKEGSSKKTKGGKNDGASRADDMTTLELLAEQKKKFLKWNDASCQRFLPGEAVDELILQIRKRKKYSGEVARYIRAEEPDLVDPFFDRYRGYFDMSGLSELLKEGTCEATIVCPLLPQYVIDEPPPLCPPQTDRVVTAKSKVVDDGDTVLAPMKLKDGAQSNKKGKKDVESGKDKEIAKSPKSPKSSNDKLPMDSSPPPPVENAWKEAHAELRLTIKLSSPLLPLWVAPPQPEVDLISFIGAKPKGPGIYDTGDLANKEFREFIISSSIELANFYQSLVESGKIDPAESKRDITKDEPNIGIKKKERRRKLLVEELHSAGTWKQIRQDMKEKILQIATEKFKVDKQEALGVGKFEFCNALYMYLMEEIQDCLHELLDKRKNSCQKLAERFDRDQPESIAKLINLRQKADQYENDGDWRSANRFHLERLIGDKGIKDPNIWFEYGAFCMRVKPKDHGKAEECFREAITLRQDHFLSLMALGALMWHRNYLDKAQVLFRKAIDQHCEEEFIPWMLLSQVHMARGERVHCKTCIRKAEMLHGIIRNNHNEFASPHLLMSEEWVYPFCLSQPIFETRALGASSPFVDAAIFLVDLHLPNEAIQLLGADTDLFTCETDKALCCAKAYEVMEQYIKAARPIVEALVEHPRDTSLWYCLGHLRYIEHRYEESIEAFEKLRRYIDERPIQHRKLSIYVHIELAYSNLQLGSYNVARKLFIKCCKLKPDFSSVWLGAGISYYFLGNFEQAEIFLVEGNCKDVTNFKIWAYLIFIALTLERFKDAELSLEQSLKTFLNPKLLEDMGDAFANHAIYRCAERCYFEAINEQPKNLSVRFKYANVLIVQGKKDLAKQEFEKVLELKDIQENDTFYGLQDNHGVTYFPKEYRRQTIQ